MKNKKRFKKCAVAAVAFSAAVNLNGCAYGPPPENYGEAADNSSLSVSEQNMQDMQDLGTENNSLDNFSVTNTSD